MLVQVAGVIGKKESDKERERYRERGLVSSKEV